MPSLHITTNDSFPTSPPASPLSFTFTPSIVEKRSRHTHRRSLAISSHLTFPNPVALDQNPALITPPLSSPALSFPKTASLESLRSGNTMLDYDSDLPPTPTVEGDSLHAVPSLDPLPPRIDGNDDIILPDAEPDVQADGVVPCKLRKVAFNDAIIYYPPRPQSSRQPSFSSQTSQHSSRETTPTISTPSLNHRRSFSSFLHPSPSFLPSSSSVHRHTRERKSWAGLIASPFTSAVRRRHSPNRYRPPTPPLGHGSLDDDDDDQLDPWQPPTPLIDLDAALGPFQTPGSQLSPTHSAKFWSLTSYVGIHRRSESAPEMRGLGFDAPFSAPNIADSTPSSRGLKRKMSVIDEEDRQLRTEETELDSELHRIMLQEGAEMGEMGELVVSLSDSDQCSKPRGWKKSFKEWWRKV